MVDGRSGADGETRLTVRTARSVRRNVVLERIEGRFALPVRLALVAAVVDAVVAVAVVAVEGLRPAALAVACGWVVVWTLISVRGPALVSPVCRSHLFWAIVPVLGLATLAGVTTGGPAQPLMSQPMWAVGVAVACRRPVRAAILAVVMAGARLGAFALAGDALTGPGDLGLPIWFIAVIWPVAIFVGSLIVTAVVDGVLEAVRADARWTARAAEVAPMEGGAAARDGVPPAMVELAVLSDQDEAPPIEPSETHIDGSVSHLTPAEREVLALLESGHHPKQIALARGTSIATVRTQIKSLKAKTGARTLVELASGTRRD